MVYQRVPWRNFQGKGALSNAVGFSFLAVLGLFLADGLAAGASVNPAGVPESFAIHAGPEQPFLASPDSPESFISGNLAPLRPCWPVTVGTPPDFRLRVIASPNACSTVERLGALVTALIFRKYQDFRESLTSP